MNRTLRIWLLVVVAVAAISVALIRRQQGASAPAVSVAPPAHSGLSLAFAGDTVITAPQPLPLQNPAVARVVEVIRAATFAFTNLELVFFEDAVSHGRPASAWPVGSASDAAELRNLGFDLVGRANNHADDHGIDGIRDTGAVLERAGLRHAGAGADLDAAAAPVIVGNAAGRVALIAVTTSVSPGGRATRPRGDIKGRPGVNALRFSANITVDAATFAALQKSAPALQPDAQVDDDRLTLLGQTIIKGERTVIEFSVNATDQRAILAQVTAARRATDVVVVALHSHEPSNASVQPADFVRAFARAAIDAGAKVVVGHGPHQLRGAEAYGGGVILYSLGNFLFPYEPLGARDADVFDAGIDLYALALGGVEAGGRRIAQPADTAAWWESVVAVARFQEGVLTGLTLYPVDLGVDLPLERRGTPTQPGRARATTILQRVATLSEPFGTKITIDGGVAVIDVVASAIGKQ